MMFPLILAAAAFLAVWLAPAPRLAGRSLSPSRASQPLLSQTACWMLAAAVNRFGRACARPPAPVLRAFHRGETLVITKGGRT
jgi:hypothetical protein